MGREANKKKMVAVATFLAGACSMGYVHAGATIKIDDEKSVTVGFAPVVGGGMASMGVTF